MDVVTHPLTPDRWDDLVAVFEGKGCSMARGCWCMYYRETGRVDPLEGVSASEDRRRRLRALASADPPAGLIAYADGVPVGWVAVAPRSAFPRLVRSPVVVDFAAEGGGVRVSETFDAETENPIELQRQGWQAILDRFARHVEEGR